MSWRDTETYISNTHGLQPHSIKEINNDKGSLCNNAERVLPGAALIPGCVHRVKYSGAHKEDSSICTDSE